MKLNFKPAYQFRDKFAARVKITKCLRQKNETSKMILKFAASDDLKILQAEVVSECEGLLNVSMRMRLTILCLKLTI